MYNGAFEATSDTVDVAPTDIMDSARIGSTSASPVFFDGSIAAVLGAQTVWTEANLTEIYGGGIPQQYDCYTTNITDTAKFFLPLNDGVDTGQEIVDQTGNSHDAFLFGTTDPVLDGQALDFAECDAEPIIHNTLMFDGVANEAVDIAADSSLDTSNATYFIRFYMDSGISGPGQPRLWDRADLPDNRFFLGWNSSTDKMRLLIETSTGSTIAADGIWTPTRSAWHTAFVVYDGANCKLYINGDSTADITIASTGAWWNTSSLTRIGADDAIGQEWEGALSQPMIFSTALSESDRTTVINSDIAQQPWQVDSTIMVNCVCALPLNDGVASGRENEDFSGNENNGVFQGTPTYTGESLAFDDTNIVYETYFFDGIGRSIRSLTSGSSLNPAAVSISFWIHSDLPDIGDGSPHTLVLNVGGKYNVEFDASGNLTFNNRLAAALSYDFKEIGEWAHVLATCDSGNNAVLYVNGVSVDTGTVDRSSSSNDTVYIGKREIAANYLEGSMTSVSIFDRDLSASEAVVLYNKNLPLAFQALPSSISDDGVLAYEMTENDTSLTDLSGNSNTGSTTGFTGLDGEDIDWQD
jgi:hypothetical protein